MQCSKDARCSLASGDMPAEAHGGRLFPRWLRGKAYIVSYCIMLAIFGVGAAVMYIVMECHLLLIISQRRPEVARLYIHRGARLLFRILQKIGLFQVTIDLREMPSGPAVVIANHPSMLDAMLLLSALPNAVCIMKRPLLRLPVIRGFARRADYIPQAEPPELLNAAKRVLATGASIIVFPEGTRSTEGGVGIFKRGAARLALEAGRPVIPISIRMEPVVLGRKWPFESPPEARIRYHAARLTPTEGDSVSLSGGAGDPRAESERVTRYLEERIRNSLL